MNNDIESINKKLDILLQFEKGLADEIRNNKSDVSDIKDDLDKIHKKIKVLEDEVNTIKKRHIPQDKRSHKDFTPKEIYEMHYSDRMSLATLARYLNCSVCTVVNNINEYKREVGSIV